LTYNILRKAPADVFQFVLVSSSVFSPPSAFPSVPRAALYVHFVRGVISRFTRRRSIFTYSLLLASVVFCLFPSLRDLTMIFCSGIPHIFWPVSPGLFYGVLRFLVFHGTRLGLGPRRVFYGPFSPGRSLGCFFLPVGRKFFPWDSCFVPPRFFVPYWRPFPAKFFNYSCCRCDLSALVFGPLLQSFLFPFPIFVRWGQGFLKLVSRRRIILFSFSFPFLFPFFSPSVTFNDPPSSSGRRTTFAPCLVQHFAGDPPVNAFPMPNQATAPATC